MKKIHFIIIATIILLSVPNAALAQSVSIPSDIAYILIDSKTGQVLVQQNADQRLGPASTTKIMTAILALENGKLDQEMKVSKEAVNDIGRGGMNVGIMAGEDGLTLDNMLHLLLIKSANETANIIAENLAATRSDFVDMMNKRAKELGAVNTTFANPSGKDTEKSDAGHLSTARDMAIKARYAMTIPKFREIVATEYYEDMPVTNKHDDWGILRNSNQFLWHNNTYPYTLDGTEHKYTVIGVKSGYTAAAGNNLVSAATGEDGMELISVVMHVTQPNKIYGYSKELLRYGFENYSLQKISGAGHVAASIKVEGTDDENIMLDLLTESEFSSALPVEKSSKDVHAKVDAPRTIQAPVRKGDVLGTVEYSSDGVVLGSVKLVAARSVEKTAAAEKEISRRESAQQQQSSYSYILLAALSVASALVITRFVVRRISRKIRKRKYAQRY